jgi:hypothetical protein
VEGGGGGVREGEGKEGGGGEGLVAVAARPVWGGREGIYSVVEEERAEEGRWRRGGRGWWRK